MEGDSGQMTEDDVCVTQENLHAYGFVRVFNEA